MSAVSVSTTRVVGKQIVSVVGGFAPASTGRGVTARVTSSGAPVRGVDGVGWVCVYLWFAWT